MYLFKAFSCILLLSRIDIAKAATSPAECEPSQGEPVSLEGVDMMMSCKETPVVTLQYASKDIDITSDFNTPSEMIEEMKTKLQEEIGKNVKLTFECNFTDWDTLKYEAMHRIHKYNNFRGLLFVATLDNNKVTLKPVEYDTLDEDELLDPFRENFHILLQQNIIKRMDGDWDVMDWVTTVDPLPKDHPLLMPVPEDDFDQLLVNRLNLLRMSFIRIANSDKLIYRVREVGGDCGEVFGPDYADETVNPQIESPTEAARVIAKANEFLFKHFELESIKVGEKAAALESDLNAQNHNLREMAVVKENIAGQLFTTEQQLIEAIKDNEASNLRISQLEETNANLESELALIRSDLQLTLVKLQASEKLLEGRDNMIKILSSGKDGYNELIAKLQADLKAKEEENARLLLDFKVEHDAKVELEKFRLKADLELQQSQERIENLKVSQKQMETRIETITTDSKSKRKELKTKLKKKRKTIKSKSKQKLSGLEEEIKSLKEANSSLGLNGQIMESMTRENTRLERELEGLRFESQRSKSEMMFQGSVFEEDCSIKSIENFLIRVGKPCPQKEYKISSASRLYYQTDSLENYDDIIQYNGFQSYLSEESRLTPEEARRVYFHYLKKFYTRSVLLESWISVALGSQFHSVSLLAVDHCGDDSFQVDELRGKLEGLVQLIEGNVNFAQDLLATIHEAILVVELPLRDTPAGRFLARCLTTNHNIYKIDPHIVNEALSELKGEVPIKRGIYKGYHFPVSINALRELEDFAHELGLSSFVDTVHDGSLVSSTVAP